MWNANAHNEFVGEVGVLLPHGQFVEHVDFPEPTVVISAQHAEHVVDRVFENDTIPPCYFWQTPQAFGCIRHFVCHDDQLTQRLFQVRV